MSSDRMEWRRVARHIACELLVESGECPHADGGGCDVLYDFAQYGYCEDCVSYCDEVREEME